MTRMKKMAWLVASAALGLAYSAPAYAQATRTWVSGTGDDANPCSRTAPCKTFAGAISKTAINGEINCIDNAGYGGVTITKSLTINCRGQMASDLNAGSNGITINAGATDRIVLNDLEIQGVGSGVKAINFIAGGSLVIRDCLILNQNTSPALGVSFTPSGASKLYIINSTITGNGASGPPIAGGGIFIQPTSTGSAKVVLDNVQVTDNAGYGIRADATLTANGVSLALNQVEASGNGQGGITAVSSGTNPISMQVTNSSSVHNGGAGISAVGSAVVARVGNTTITGNTAGVATAAGGTINSYGDNRLNGNTTDGAFSGSVTKQ